MPKPKYKAVIFDLDDTLVETRTIKWVQHKYVAKKFYNIDLTDETLLKHWGKPLDTLLQEIFQYSDTLENIHKVIGSVRHNFPKKVYAGSVEAVTKLLDDGIKVGILSATNKNFILENLDRFNFPTDRLTIIQGAEETLVHKPDPEVFSKIFETLKQEKIEKKEIVYIGDSLDDLRAARRAGINFIAVTTGLYSHDDFKKHGANVILKDIREVVEKII